jgi:hypothetical protein
LYDIIDDPEFKPSKNAFQAQCVVLKKKGLAGVAYHPPIPKEDLKRLYESNCFDISTPVGLQRKVFFEIQIHFCRRAMEGLRELTVDDFVLGTTANGTECLFSTDELEKNHQADDENADISMMVATGSSACPVSSYKFYLKMLNPKLSTLFQRPKASTPSTGCWYDNQVIGVKTLQGMMKSISKEANLSKIYTNHSIRATSITILDESGVHSRDICSVSGHTSEKSLRSYCKTSNKRKEEMSTLIAKSTSSSISPVQSSISQDIDFQRKSVNSASAQVKKTSESSTITITAPETSAIRATAASSSIQKQQRVLERQLGIENLDNFVPNFNLASILDSPVKTSSPSRALYPDDIQVCPSENELYEEFQLQQKQGSLFGSGNMFKNVTINVNPIIIHKVNNKRRRIAFIESDSGSSQE